MTTAFQWTGTTLLVLTLGIASGGCSESSTSEPPPPQVGGFTTTSAPAPQVTSFATTTLPPPPPGDQWAVELIDPAIVKGVPGELELQITNSPSSSTAIDKLTFKLPDDLPYTLLGAIPPAGWVVDKMDQSSREWVLLTNDPALEIQPGQVVTVRLQVRAAVGILGDTDTPNDTFEKMDASGIGDTPWTGYPTWVRHAFEAYLSAAPSLVSVGETLTLTLTVTNRVLIPKSITPTPPTLTGTAGFTLASGPTPASLTLGFNQSGTFTWTYLATGNGTTTFETSATAPPLFGRPSTSPPTRAEVEVRDFGAQLSLSPLQAIPNSTVTVSMLVVNKTGAKLFGIVPSSSATGSATATALSGPTPTSADIAHGSAAAFTWTYQVSGPLYSTYRFEGSAVAGGGLVTNLALTQEGVIVPVAVTIAPTLVPSGAANVDLEYTVRNGASSGNIKEVLITPASNLLWGRHRDPFQNDTSGWSTSTTGGFLQTTYRFQAQNSGQEIPPQGQEELTVTFRRAPTVGAPRTEHFQVEYKGDFDGNTFATVTVAPPPVITGFVPGEGPVGTAVTILGRNFDPDLTGDTVTFSNGVEAQVVAASGTQLTVIVPSGAVTGPVTVATTVGTATSPTDFVVLKGTPNGNPGPPLAVSGFVLAVGGDPIRASQAYLVFAGANPRLTVLSTSGVTPSVVRDIPYGVATQNLAVKSSGTVVYVSDSASNRLAEIDSDTGVVLREFSTGVWPYGVTLGTGDTKALITNVFGFSASVIDLAAGLGVELPLGADSTPQFGATFNGGNDVLITHWYGGLVSRVDLGAPSLTDQIAIGPITDMGEEGIVITNGRAFITQYLTHEVLVLDIATRAVVARIAAGLNPFGIALSPDESQVYVANESNDEVTVLDTQTLEVVNRINLAPATYPFSVGFARDGSALVGGDNSVVKIE